MANSEKRVKIDPSFGLATFEILDESGNKIEVFNLENLQNVPDPFDADTALSDFNSSNSEPDDTHERVNDDAKSQDSAKQKIISDKNKKELKLSHPASSQDESYESLFANNLIHSQWKDWNDLETDDKTILKKALSIHAEASKNTSLDAKLLQNIKECGWYKPKIVQRLAIPLILIGTNNMFIASETGSGKTGAFLIPIAQILISSPEKKHGVCSLVVAPTRELAKQISDVAHSLLRDLPFKIGCAVGKLATEKQIRQIKTCRLLTCTVGRLHQLLFGVEFTPLKLDEFIFPHLEIAVFDEIDKLFEKGKVAKIRDLLAKCRKETCYIFTSATVFFSLREQNDTNEKTVELPKYVASLLKSKKQFLQIDCQANNSREQESSSVSIPSNLKFLYIRCQYEQKFAGIFAIIRNILQSNYEANNTKVLVFTRSIDFSNVVFNILKILCKDLDIEISLLNSSQSQKSRFKVLEKFHSNAKFCLMITTDVVARGIDFKNVFHVFQVQAPINMSTFVHRAGRAARGTPNLEGNIYIFAEPNDAKLYDELFNKLPNFKNRVKHTNYNSLSQYGDMFVTLAKLAINVESMRNQAKKAHNNVASFSKLAREADILDSDDEIEIHMDKKDQRLLAKVRSENVQLEKVESQLKKLMDKVMKLK